MPSEFLCPEPPLTTKFENQLDNIGVPLSVNYFFFNVENKCSSRFKNPQKLFTSREEPFNILIWGYSSV